MHRGSWFSKLQSVSMLQGSRPLGLGMTVSVGMGAMWKFVGDLFTGSKNH